MKITGKEKITEGMALKLELPFIYKLKGPKFIMERVEMLIVDDLGIARSCPLRRLLHHSTH